MFTFMRFGVWLTFSLHVLSAVKANLLFNRAPQITTLPSACSTVEEAISSCESVSPGFSTLDPTNQAACLCYSSTSWDPEFFDGAVTSCARGLSAQGDLADYSIFKRLAGFCTSVGDIGNPPTTTTTPRLVGHSSTRRPLLSPGGPSTPTSTASATSVISATSATTGSGSSFSGAHCISETVVCLYF
jgi:hypothetical protein